MLVDMTHSLAFSRACIRATCLSIALAQIAMATLASGQRGYDPGLLVRIDGDTVRTGIRAVSALRTPQSFAYRDSGGDAHEALPNEFFVVEYENGARFERHVIPVDKSEERLRLTPEPTSEVSTELAFLEVLVRGDSLRLYRLSTGLNERYYVAAPGRVPELLSFRRYRAEDGERAIEAVRVFA